MEQITDESIKPKIEAVGAVKLTTEEKIEVKKAAFDPSTLRIDEEKSKGIRKEGKLKASNLKIAYDNEGRKVFLKTSPWFVGRDRSILAENEFIESIRSLPDIPNPQRLYEDLIRGLKAEELAWQLANHIGVPMAETHFVEIDGKPFIAYEFLEGVEDQGFGGLNFQFAENEPSKLESQEIALAYGALFKFLTDATGDQGQYLQDGEGNVYLSDIMISSDQNLTSVREGEDTRRLLEQVMMQTIYNGGYFATALTTLEHQIDGIPTPEFQETLEQLETISSETIVKLVSESPSNPSEDDIRLSLKIAQRAHGARKIFNLLSEGRNDAIRILNPIDGSTKKSAFPEEEVRKARASLFKKLREEKST